ncbi:MAG TPA: hypothetical protein VE863_02130 [Pyrinomonadaceae bacterium]|nr:hypothetical protein [Pyrinomonadaceae bacterium]
MQRTIERKKWNSDATRWLKSIVDEWLEKYGVLLGFVIGWCLLIAAALYLKYRFVKRL